MGYFSYNIPRCFQIKLDQNYIYFFRFWLTSRGDWLQKKYGATPSINQMPDYTNRNSLVCVYVFTLVLIAAFS